MTIPTSKYTAGVRIAGIGTSSNGTTSATVWATRGAARLISALSLPQWIADCLVELPQTVERRVDPWASRYETGPMSFELDLATVGDVIPVQGWEPVVNFAATASATATTIFLTTGIYGGVVYAGDETILLTGATITYISDGLWQYAGVTRGLHGSRPHEQVEGEPIFTAPPSWRGRLVELLVVRGDSATPRVRWSGYLDNIKASNNGTRVVLECREILDGLADRQLGLGAVDLNAAGGASVDLYTQARLAGQLPFVGAVRKPWTAPRKVCIQVGESLWVVNQVSPDILDLSLATLVYGTLDLKVDELKEENFGAFAPLDLPIYELFVVSRELDERFGDVSVTSQLAEQERYHPLALAFALLTSSPAPTELVDPLEFDIFGAAWALNAWAFTDVEGWAALIASTPEVQIDQTYKAWSGAPEDAIDMIVDLLLRPYGFFLTITEEGLMGVARLISPTIRDLCEAQDRLVPIVRPSSGGQLGWEYEVGSAVGEITALVGAVPWSPEASSVTIRSTERTPRSAALADSRIYTYDLSTRSKASVASFFDGDRGDRLIAMLIDRAIRASWALPRLLITALDSRAIGPTVRYDLGAFVLLASPLPPAPIFRLPTGERVDPSDPDAQVYFLGQILGARQNLPNQTWELELLLLSWRTGQVARFRAPSALIEAYYEGGDIELEIWTDSEFGGTTTDAVGFAAGDEVTFWERDGTDTGEAPRTVTARLDRILVLDGPTAENMSDKVLRLAPSNVYANTGSAALVPCSDRPWVYAADGADQINRPVGVEVADIYG